ncbi:MAG: BON domain-containing protein [Pseudomonadota bacterium]
MIRVVLVLSLTLLAACAQNRSLGDRIDDTSASLALKRKLLLERDVHTGDIDMTFFEGRLLLAGTVRSEADAVIIEEKAAEIASVDEVINELVVGPRTSLAQGPRDTMIDQRLQTALFADTGVKSGNYRILVSQGTVYLLGVAQGPNELTRVTGQAQALDGVKEVVSHVIYLRDPRRGR